jgi:hypothetical protein
MSEGEAPDWLRDAGRGAWRDALLYLRTAFGFLRAPGRFTQAWASGAETALNPLGMLATGAGLVAAADGLLGRALAIPERDSSLLIDVLVAAAPFAHYAALGLLAHLCFSGLGSTRRMRDSVGIALFAGAGPAALTQSLGDLIALLAWLSAGHPPYQRGGLFTMLHGPARAVLSFEAFGGYFAFLSTFALALAALHGKPWWKAALVLLLSVAVLGVIFSALPAVPCGTRVIVDLSVPRWLLYVD